MQSLLGRLALTVHKSADNTWQAGKRASLRRSLVNRPARITGLLATSVLASVERHCIRADGSGSSRACHHVARSHRMVHSAFVCARSTLAAKRRLLDDTNRVPCLPRVACRPVGAMLLAGRNTGAAPLACQSRHSRAQQSSCRRVIAARAAATEEFTPAEGPLSVPDEGPSFSPLGDEDEVPESGVAVAHLRFVGGSASKVRRVLNMIRGKPYGQAIQLMTCSPYRCWLSNCSCFGKVVNQ